MWSQSQSTSRTDRRTDGVPVAFPWRRIVASRSKNGIKSQYADYVLTLQGIIDVGGFRNVFDICADNGRMNMAK